MSLARLALIWLLLLAVSSHAAPESAPPSGETARLGMYMKIARDLHRSDERAAIMDRLLELTHGEDAATLALELAKLYDGLGDPDAMARALERGFTESPRDAALRDRLLAHLRETEQRERLAEMRVTEGRAADCADAGDATPGRLDDGGRFSRKEFTPSAKSGRPKLSTIRTFARRSAAPMPSRRSS